MYSGTLNEISCQYIQFSCFVNDVLPIKHHSQKEIKIVKNRVSCYKKQNNGIFLLIPLYSFLTTYLLGILGKEELRQHKSTTELNY